MSKKVVVSAAIIVMIASVALAGSSFQNTCSNIEFAYLGNEAGINAVCLRRDGSPNATSLVLMGISNQNGILTQ
jgi:hypothetical protein